MPRKGLRPRDRRGLPPADYKYNSVLVSRLVNKLNFQGKKLTAETVVYGAMDIIAEKTKQDAVAVLTQAIENVRPLLEVKARRVGGATYQVPIEVQPMRSTTIAMRWIIDAARQKAGKPMAVRLADELLAANKKEGVAFKKREDTHKMAEANRAFAHYRW
ncbi:MAG: 30S ribosomal protein S7 [Elusimicrobia bacterium]|nr:30S ribosomal protein S7 [Elusimicrobiota bacterium]MDE2237542.1 30S ribosomal protein S7 [Elusimicrobiota bacterium]MDE2426972.1 30S ribosomal protein S7 [Elusimicrobiota bacterium]